MLAGLFDGKAIVSKNKEDIAVGGKFYSVKSGEPDKYGKAGFDSGSLINGFYNELKDMQEDGVDTTLL